MITAATVERFRGLRRLEVEGFGRVNLIIGKNNCGKTALMEALLIADASPRAAHAAVVLQGYRRAGVGVGDFERFWRPMFWNHDADRGFSIEVRNARPEPLRIDLRTSTTPPTMLTEPVDAAGASSTWALDLRVIDGGQRTEQIVGGPTGIRLPTTSPLAPGWWWVASNHNLGAADIGLFSRLKRAGREDELLEVLREVDGRVSGIDILALTGTEAELFVRLAPGSPLLPIAMMGDGFQRCFEMAVGAVTGESLFVDELENGLHHSVLERVWRWLAVVSAKRNLQVFATTHSEECIHAAAAAFTALNDDGLRVIRLDRREDHTTAAIYDRQLVETAVEIGMELRG